MNNKLLKTTIIDKVALILIEKEKLLCVRSKNKTVFYIPGGKRETNESDKQALIREIHEEINIALEPNNLIYAHTFIGPADGLIDTKVKLTCYFVKSYNGKIVASSEIEEINWVNSQNIDICSESCKLIILWLQSQGLIN